jgi:acetylglutamate kinase
MIMKLKIIKIGGKIINDKAKLAEALKDFAAIKIPKILVHGGGRKASELSQQMNIEPTMINGRRVTDEATLEIVTMVYSGLLNTQIVADLQALGCNAMGLNGTDLNTIQTHKRIVKDIDFGFVGDIDFCNSELLSQLINLGISPVFCAITHDKKGQLLNTNADTIASALAVSLSRYFEVELAYTFEKAGVLYDAEDDNSLIPLITKSDYEQLKIDKIIFDGMIPKIDNAFLALENGVGLVEIGGTKFVLNYSFNTECIKT